MADRDIADIDLRAVRRGALAIASGIVFAGLASWFLLRELGPAANTPPLARQEASFSPGPRLQPAPQPERAAYFAEKARQTSTYGWVDREAGIARIPLEEAMRLLAARGLKAGAGRAPSSPAQSSAAKERH
jgi:hypothetical protein